MNKEINEDEVFEKKESKIKPKLQKIMKNKKVLSLIILVLVIVILAILEGTTNCISSLWSGMGNSIGNISNCGYAVGKGDYIYYVAPSEDMNTTNIYRAKNGSSEFETIFSGNYDIRALNVKGNKLYFISISYEDTSDEDAVDNKIYKMSLDGSDLTVINDNDFAYDSYDMYLVKNKIYYVGEDHNVYKMDLNGENRELVIETGTGFLALNEKYIIYNKENEDGSDYTTHISSLNGKDEKQLNSNRIFTPNIVKDTIYYINDKQNIAKINVNGGEEEIIYDGSAYNMNIYKDSIYYLNYKDEANEDYAVCIYKVSINGGEPELVKEFSYYSSFMDIVNDSIYYMDMDEEKAFINLVNTNDLSEIKLYEWDYNNEASVELPEETTTDTPSAE